MDLQEQLNEALDAAQAARKAYGEAALATAEGVEGASVKEAAQARDAADARVADLRAAIEAAEEREDARIAEEEEADKRAERDATIAAQRAVQAAGRAWDETVDILAEKTADLIAAEGALYARNRGGGRQLEDARRLAIECVRYKLRAYCGDGAPFFRHPQLTSHLPQVWGE
jgi:hypothetical protein